MNSIITRFAPSPTGNLHIGGVRTALINYVVTENAKNKFPNSKFYLRIEDTDLKRSKNEFKNSILNGLNWLNINFDDEPYLQSKKIKRHQEIAFKLLENNKAFKCICSEESLENKRKKNLENKINDKKLCKTCENDEKIQNSKEGFVIRIKIPNKGETLIKDIIQGDVTVKNDEIDNFILLRKDGSPTYMLSVVVDDHDLGINLIIRGDDHLNNAFRQNFIYTNMNWLLPKYAHLPLIHGNDGKKLSKRHGAIDINDFKEKGYLEESIINNLILLGWSPDQKNEIIELKEIINKFELKKISKSSSIFNFDKLNFFNNYYINNDNNYDRFYNYCKNNLTLKKFLETDEKKLNRIFNVYKKELNYFKNLEDICIPYFDDDFLTNHSNLLDSNFDNLVSEFVSILIDINIWDKELISEKIKTFINNKKVKFVLFGKPLRLLLINSENGPSINDILYILGKKNSIQRIKNYISKK